MKNIKIVFFDMGNTIIDFHLMKPDVEKDKIGLERIGEYLKQKNKEINIDQFVNEVMNPWNSYLENNRKKTLKEYNISSKIRAYFNSKSIDISNNEIIELLAQHFSEYVNFAKINEGFIELVEYLKSKKIIIGLISNIPYPEEVFYSIFKKLNIYNIFDSIEFSYSNKMKPDKYIFIRSLNKFSVDPGNTLMVGDNYHADIEPAISLGMKTCLYDNKYKNKDNSKEDIYINNFQQLIDIIE